MSILLYECKTWTLTKRIEKRLDGNYTRILQAILNKSWRQHPTKQQVYGHRPPITKTVKIRRSRHAGHCWRSRDKLVSDVLLWTPSHGRPARTYIQQLCADMGCNPKDQPEAIDDRKEWWERVRDICTDGMMMRMMIYVYVCVCVCVCIYIVLDCNEFQFNYYFHYPLLDKYL